MTNADSPGTSARDIAKEVQKREIRVVIPEEGSAVTAGAIVAACEEKGIDRKQVHARLREMVEGGELLRIKDVDRGRPMVWYRRLLEFNRPMPEGYRKAILSAVKEDEEGGKMLTPDELEVFHKRHTAILEWAHMWCVVQGIRAPNEEQAGVVIAGYTRDLLEPYLREYVAVLRRNEGSERLVRER